MSEFWEIVASNALMVTVMALVVGLTGRIWKNPHGRHLLWVFVLVKLLLPPLVTIPIALPANEVAITSSPPYHAASLPFSSSKESDSDHVVTSLTQKSSPMNSDPVRPSGSGIPTVAWLRDVSWVFLLSCVWGVGSVGLALVYGSAILRFQRLLRFAQPAPSRVSGMAKAICQQLGLRQIPKVLMLPVRLSPLIWAVGGRPRVVLPTELCERLDPAALRTILVHELAHIQRRDHFVRVLELLTTTLFWWHPVTWWASRQLRELEEECCDSIVLGTVPFGVKAYATAIMDTLDFLSEGPVTAPLASTTVRPSISLARRIRMLQDNTPVRQLRLGHLLMLAALLVFPMAIAVAATTQSDSKQISAGVQNRTPRSILARATVQNQSGEQPSAAPADETEKAPVKPIVGQNAAGEKVLNEPVMGKNYIIMPINTDLQRAAGPKYKNGKVFVLINGMGLLNEDNTVLNATAVDFNGLAKALESIMLDGVRGTAIFRLLLQPHDPSRVSPGASDMYASFLRDHATGWFGEKSIEQVSGSKEHNWQNPDDWKSLAVKLTESPLPGTNQDETGIGDDQVKVYAVRTPLSRYLYSRQIDCVVHIIPPIDEANENVVQTIERALPQLKLEKKAQVRLLWNAKETGPGNTARHKLFGKQIWKDLLGFKGCSDYLWQ